MVFIIFVITSSPMSTALIYLYVQAVFTMIKYIMITFIYKHCEMENLISIRKCMCQILPMEKVIHFFQLYFATDGHF